MESTFWIWSPGRGSLHLAIEKIKLSSHIARNYPVNTFPLEDTGLPAQFLMKVLYQSSDSRILEKKHCKKIPVLTVLKKKKASWFPHTISKAKIFL